MENMGKRFAKWKRMVRQQKGKLYIMRVCISMLLGWHKYSKATYMGSN
ncbi:small polypeptide DEVIL 5-like [Quercus robur]|nr:small polypeptide DEVIL 5-like [Quercus robur]